MRFCRKCGTGNKVEAGFCKSCGANLAGASAVAPSDVAGESAAPVCHACHAPLLSGARFCKKCGTAVALSPEPPVVAPSPPVTESLAVAAEPFASDSPSTPNSHLVIAAVVIVISLSVLIVGGFYWWGNNKSPAAVPAQTAAPVALTPAVPGSGDVSSADKPLSVAVSPAPPSSTTVLAGPGAGQPAGQQTKLKPTAAGNPAMQEKRVPAAATPTRQAPQADPLADKIAGLLKKAKKHLAKEQYDKAIATAESVLALDPENASAQTLIRKAKSRQKKALAAGATIE